MLENNGDVGLPAGLGLLHLITKGSHRGCSFTDVYSFRNASFAISSMALDALH